MNDNLTAEWELYEKGKDYNRRIGLYSNVDRNERFYAGDQWNGVQANGLPTPVFNIFKRVINYFIASILSQKVKMQFGVENISTDTMDPAQQGLLETADKLSKHMGLKWEKLKIDSMLRDGLLDAALSGDMVAFTYWDDSINTGQNYGTEPIMGDFCTELVDSVNVMLGNPNNRNPQKQPYILIAGRQPVYELKEEAKRNKVSVEDIKKITADDEYLEQSGDRGKIEIDHQDDNAKALFVIKLWKDKNTGFVMWNKATKYVYIRKDVTMNVKRYPVALMNWDKRKNSYHGQALGTGLVNNQIYINKQFAMVMKHMMDTAFGKVVYDSSRIQSWSNQVGQAVPVNGEVSGAVQQIMPGQMNNVVMEVIDQTMQYTKDLIGASDAALGNVDPKNTSAIIAVSQQASIPLENVKANLYQFVEDLGLIWLDFMLYKYNVPRQLPYEEKGQTKIMEFDGTQFQDILWSIKVDVGPSSYWSEITSMQTLDNLLNTDKITFLQYLDRIPDGYINKKQELIDELKNQDLDKQILYTAMAQFMDTLLPQEQIRLQQMPPEQMEMEVKNMMVQQQQAPQMM